VKRVRLGPDTRLMVWAPHPDDETLSSGFLIQATLRAGGRVRVVFLTDGDNNPWPQRWLERRWGLGPADRARWGARRRQEAQHATRVLGLDRADLRFLSYPDQGLTALLLAADAGLTGTLARELLRWRPTILVTPCMEDLHPDHSATALLARVALCRISRGAQTPIHLEYLVHGVPQRPAALRLADPLLWPPKREALLCHRSQVALVSRVKMSGRGRPELFSLAGAAPPVGGGRFAVALAPRLGAFGPIHLVLLELHEDGAPWAHRVRLPLTCTCHLSTRGDTSWTVRRTLRSMAVQGRGSPCDQGTPTFLKVERSFGFFDEAGWKALGAPAR
jgi:LmbE family N-acetylglucosaminyl deacetylase